MVTVRGSIRSHLQAGAASRFRELGVWGEQTLAEIVDEHAAAQPGKLAVADQHVRWSYGEFVELSKKTAQVLLDLGVRPGDPVVAQVPGCAVLPLIHVAANRIGALFIPASDGWRQAEMTSLLRTSRATALFAAAENHGFDLRAMYDEVRLDLPDLLAIVYARSGGNDCLERLIERTPPISDADAARLRPDPDAPAHVMVSSGTTGIPKAGAWGGNDIVALLKHHFTEAIHLRPDDVAGGLAPANVGSTGYVFPVLAPLLAGATSVILERWSPAAALDLIVAERCTYATAIPTQMTMLVSEPSLSQHDLSLLTRFNNAGAPLPPHVAEQIETSMGVRVQNAYGASDGGLPTLTSVDDPPDKRWTTVGRTPAGQEVQLRDPFGEPVSGDVEGEVWWRGPNKSFGYVNQPDYEAEAWDDEGWYRSGDLGRIDAEGYLRITGRAKEMILRGGANIFPAELENILIDHPNVASVAVVGVPDERLGERACVVVVGRPGAPEPTLADLTGLLAERGVARFKHPELFLLVEEIPMNMGGKFDRIALRKLAAGAAPAGKESAPTC